MLVHMQVPFIEHDGRLSGARTISGSCMPTQQFNNYEKFEVRLYSHCSKNTFCAVYGAFEDRQKNVGLQNATTSVLSDSQLLGYFFAMKKSKLTIGKTSDNKAVSCRSFRPYTGIALYLIMH